MKDDRFKSSVAVLVAIVTILGAMAACLATVAGSGASDADFSGVSAAIKAQKAEIVNDVTAYEHYRAYTSYVRYDEMGNLIYDESVNSSEQEAQALAHQRMEAWGLADALRIYFFPPRYIDPNTGKYNIHRELEELWAEDVQEDDLNPRPHFEKADLLRQRSLLLTGDMIVFAIAFWFLSLAQIFESRAKYLALALGILIAVAGILGIVIVELIA
jgi:hypothetical protein